MRYTTWLAVLIMGFAVMGMVAADTTEMAGGVEVSTTGTGASGGHAYVFTTDGDVNGGSISANILANATVKGISSAKIKTDVLTLQSKKVTYGPYDLAVSAQGTVDVTAEGHSNAAAVNSRAQIYASASTLSGYQEGYAYIASQIYGVDNQPTKGAFYADSSANGKATYSVTNNTGIDGISGGVAGKTTLEAQSTSDHANLMGVNAAMLPEGLPVDTYTEIMPDTNPLLAAIASGATTNENMLKGEGVGAGVANIIQLSAINDGLPADSLSYAAATVEDTMASASGVNITTSGMERKASATKSAKMSADVRVVKALDSAAAISLLATGARSIEDNAPLTAAVARTYAAVNRENAGSMADGSDRAWGEAFISSGNWNAWGATLDKKSGLVEKATVSGNLVQDWNQVGLGSGAFLQYKKNGLAFADIGITQGSSSELEDMQEIDAEIMGPKAHSLGSSGWDGSGVSANMKDLHVDATNKEDTDDDWAPDTISTDIADVDAYLWCDGTNDLQYNGLYMGASNPVFDPAGNGQFSGVVATYLPSPTQRLTAIGILTTQPSPI